MAEAQKTLKSFNVTAEVLHDLDESLDNLEMAWRRHATVVSMFLRSSQKVLAGKNSLPRSTTPLAKRIHEIKTRIETLYREINDVNDRLEF